MENKSKQIYKMNSQCGEIKRSVSENIFVMKKTMQLKIK